jgi:hypothetical protein
MRSNLYMFLMGVNDDKSATPLGFDASGRLAYSWPGNTDFMGACTAPKESRITAGIFWGEEGLPRITRPDIFVNCIANPEIMTRSLEKAAALIDRAQTRRGPVAVFNDPCCIAATRRDLIYERFHALPGLDIPKTLRCIPESPEDVLATAKHENLRFPFIVRPCGARGSIDMVKVNAAGDADTLDVFAFDGSPFTLTEFRDYKGADGLYAKTRFTLMNGKVYPRHTIFSKGWKIRAVTRGELMNRDPALKNREKEQLEALTARLAPEALASVHKIADAIGLDYLGFDACVRQDGTLTVFEVSAAQGLTGTPNLRLFPYLASFRETLLRDFNLLVQEKAEAARAKKSA